MYAKARELSQQIAIYDRLNSAPLITAYVMVDGEPVDVPIPPVERLDHWLQRHFGVIA